MSVVIHRLPQGVEAVIQEARDRQRRRRVRLALMLALAAGAGGIGYGLSERASGNKSPASCTTGHCASVGSPTGAIPNPQPFRVVATPFAVPKFSGRDLLTGRPVSNADLAGRVGFLLLWQDDAYCPPCKGDLAALQAFAHAHPRIPIVGLDVADRPALAKATLRQNHVSFPSISVSVDAPLMTFLAAWTLKSGATVGYPNLYAFDSHGRVVAISAGYGGKRRSDVLAAEAARIRR